MRPRRPRLLAILWLLVALLPLRGWAFAQMTATVSLDAAAAVETAPACHGHAAQEQPSGTDGSAHHGGCAMCDVCHGVAMPVAQVDSASPRPEFDGKPRGDAAVSDAGPTRLFKPPRL